MSTTTTPASTTAGTTPTRAPRARNRPAPAPIPTGRLLLVELRKMFDTRSGFWLLASIAITATLATGAVILWAPQDDLTFATFGAAIGFPMAVILPMIAILSVTSEWSQRSGLTTFTLVPHRGRVVSAKAIVVLGTAVASMALAFAIGAVGNLVGTAMAGTDLVWDMGLDDFGYIVGANTLGMLMGFMLGVLVRNSAGAIVAYFVYSLVEPPLSQLLAAAQSWFADLRPWVDFNYNQNMLFEGGFTSEQWANLAVSGGLWLIAPLGIGLALLLRSEVK
ncbi:ABC transporter permease [Nocardioides ferulae]|uniref:ABC transporter permease n=1 Tax=Nocardioides ferulae TaxID=2340821 RepID=UPI000EAD9C4A|nr:ABC transporter permease [Nocardioides ferulae]